MGLEDQFQELDLIIKRLKDDLKYNDPKIISWLVQNNVLQYVEKGLGYKILKKIEDLKENE